MTSVILRLRSQTVSHAVCVYQRCLNHHREKSPDTSRMTNNNQWDRNMYWLYLFSVDFYAYSFTKWTSVMFGHNELTIVFVSCKQWIKNHNQNLKCIMRGTANHCTKKTKRQKKLEKTDTGLHYSVWFSMLVVFSTTFFHGREWRESSSLWSQILCVSFGKVTEVTQTNITSLITGDQMS